MEILIFLLAGIVLGVITGIIPGIHPNTVFMYLLILSPLFMNQPAAYILTFVISISITNTFIDFIPSIVFGAPEEDSTLSILPGHEMLFEGRGYEAVALTAVGGLVVVLLTVISLPFIYFILPIFHAYTKGVMGWVILLVVIWMIFNEKGKNRIYALTVLLLSGAFGIVTLNAYPLAVFPSLTGMFGLSSLLLSIHRKVNIPKQKIYTNIHGKWIEGSIAGWIGGMIASVIPGIGSSQSGVLASQIFQSDRQTFLITIGGINTANIIFTLIYFFLTSKTRSGAAWFLSQIDIFISNIWILAASAMFTAFVSFVLTIKLSEIVIGHINRIDYTLISGIVIIILVILTFMLTGVNGMLILLSGTMVGLYTITAGTRRSYMMGYLMLPTILYFLGFYHIIYTFM